MKKIRLLTSLVSTTVIAGILPAVITSCNSDNRSIYIEDTNKTKTFNLYQESELKTTTQTLSGFTANNFSSDAEIKAEIKNISKFVGTIKVTNVTKENNQLSLDIQFDSPNDPLIGLDASFDIVFTANGFSQTISGFNVHFTGSVFSVSINAATVYFEQKVYAAAGVTEADTVVKTFFTAYKNGQEDLDIDQYYVDPVTPNENITPTIVAGNNGLFYVNLHITNFAPTARFEYKFYFKNRQSPSFKSAEQITAYLTYSNDENDKFSVTGAASGSGGCRITSCNIADATEVVIPSQINGKDVTDIDLSAFDYNARLTSITFPSTLSYFVPRSANTSGIFKGCYKLQEVKVDSANTTFTSTNLDGSVNYNCIMKKGVGAEPTELIYGCAATTIPESIITIDDGAFYECLDLEFISIPVNVATIGKAAFKRCANLNKITIKGNIGEIKDNVFEDCKSLTNVNVETTGSITKLGSYAFSNCTSLTEIYIPASCTSIASDTFAYCGNVETITVSTDNTVYASLIDFVPCNGIFSINGKTLYVGCKNTTIPSTVETINSRAFWGCSGLKNITIPNSVKTIGLAAFQECVNLESIVVPESVTSIQTLAFSECYKLKSAEINAQITKTPMYMFQQCYLLESLTLPLTLETIENYTCTYCYSLLSIKIPRFVTKINHLSFTSSNFESVDFENPTSWVLDGITPYEVPTEELSDPSSAAELINEELPVWYSLYRKA